MNRKTKSSVTLLLLVALVGTGVFLYASYVGSVPDVPPSENVDTDGDGVADASVGFSMFQALRVVYEDGSDSWFYPESRTSLSPMLIRDPVEGAKQVSSLQTYLFFNLASSKEVMLVEFSCDASTAIYNGNKELVKVLGQMPISKVLGGIGEPAVPLGSDVIVVSASMSASDFEELFYNPPLVTNNYFVVSCSNIEASVRFSDGYSVVFGLTGVQESTNMLWWQFVRFPYSLTMESVEWSWK